MSGDMEFTGIARSTVHDSLHVVTGIVRGRRSRRFPVALPRWERRRMVATKRKMSRRLQLTLDAYTPRALSEAIW